MKRKQRKPTARRLPRAAKDSLGSLAKNTIGIMKYLDVHLRAFRRRSKSEDLLQTDAVIREELVRACQHLKVELDLVVDLTKEIERLGPVIDVDFKSSYFSPRPVLLLLPVKRLKKRAGLVRL